MTDVEGKTCLNCGAARSGPFCQECGQRGQIHRSLRTYSADFAAGLFNFEGKFWRTLPMLAWKPGELTRRYVDGERAKFISPIGLYLFSVFLMFAVLNFNGALTTNLNKGMQNNLQTVIAEEQGALAKLEGDRRAALAEGKSVAALDRKIASARDDLKQMRAVGNGVMVVDDTDLQRAPPWARELVARVQKDPDQLVYNIQDAASKYSWLLIPLSVPFMWLLFPFYRSHHLFDHAVFVTYSLSFMMVLVIAAGLLVWLNLPVLASLLIFVPPIHMYRQLKGAYRLGTFSALVRTFLLLTFAFIAVGFFAAAIFGLGMFA